MIDPEDFASRSRDAKTETQLVKVLKQLTVSERWKYVRAALTSDKVKNRNLPNALVIAPKLGLTSNNLVEILDISLVVADPSSMGNYLKAVLPGLGYKRVVMYFREKLIQHPEQVGMALYFLPNFEPTPNEDQKDLIMGLSSEFIEHVSKLDIRSRYLTACLRNENGHT